MNELYKELIKTKKYAHIAPDVLERVCTEASEKYKKPKDALKAAKTELHIIHESYLTNECHKKAAALLEHYGGEDIMTDKDFCLSLMKLHASSKERVEYVEDIYNFLSRYVQSDTVLGDIGCGFSPFAVPFFAQAPAEYHAYEINSDTVDVLNSFFSKISSEYSAQTLDAVTNVPDIRFDTVLLFKLLPVLQRQKKGRAFDVLSALNFEKAIVSFPLKSLSGKEKGMTGHYSAFLEEGLPSEIDIIEKHAVGNELFYVLGKNKAD